MELNPGYKQTEVGVIPEEWDVKRLDDLGLVVRGGSPRPAGDPKYFNGSFIPWLTVAALTNIPASQLYVSDTVGYLTEEGAKHSRTLQQGTLIIANSGAKTLGVAKILSVTSCANDGIAAILNLSEGDKRFLCHYLNSQTQRLREVVATGNDQLNLNTTLIRMIAVPFPTDSEQRAIGEALSDMDALTDALNQLIAKKRNIKQGAMQELLTGKKRLSGFSGQWNTRKLGEITEIKKGQLITEKDAINGNVPVIAGGKQPAYYHNKTNRIGKTITISASGANAGYVAFFDSPIFASDCCTIGESAGYVIEFIYQQLILKQDKIHKLQTGGAQPHVHSSDLAPMELGFPEKKEQQAIAEILLDMDAEIAALEQRREKTRLLKQGMMQELLTGKIRLV